MSNTNEEMVHSMSNQALESKAMTWSYFNVTATYIGIAIAYALLEIARQIGKRNE